MVKPITDICNCKELIVQNTNLYLKVRRSGLGHKIKYNNTPYLRKDQNETITASICNTGLRGNVFA